MYCYGRDVIIATKRNDVGLSFYFYKSKMVLKLEPCKWGWWKRYSNKMTNIRHLQPDFEHFVQYTHALCVDIMNAKTQLKCN